MKFRVIPHTAAGPHRHDCLSLYRLCGTTVHSHHKRQPYARLEEAIGECQQCITDCVDSAWDYFHNTFLSVMKKSTGF